MRYYTTPVDARPQAGGDKRTFELRSSYPIGHHLGHHPSWDTAPAPPRENGALLFRTTLLSGNTKDGQIGIVDGVLCSISGLEQQEAGGALLGRDWAKCTEHICTWEFIGNKRSRSSTEYSVLILTRARYLLSVLLTLSNEAST